MSNLEIGIWSFPVLLLLIFLRIPIGLAMVLVAIIGNALVRGSFSPILFQLNDLTYSIFSNYSLSIIPLFLLMGQFATIGGMSQSLFNAAQSFFGHKKGGLAMASIGACAGFGAICGSSLATAGTIGQVALPELKKQTYSGSLATGALAAGGTLGILIPPSIILVIYSIIAEQNIAKMFVAALVPGVLAVIGYMITIAIIVRLKPGSAGKIERASWQQRLNSLTSIWPVLALFFIVVGGMYLGVFTPTEAAAIGAVATGFMAYFSGSLNKQSFIKAALKTAKTTAMIFLIIFGASLFNSFLALTQLPQQIAILVVEQNISPYLFLALILLIYLIFGAVMDSLSMILLSVPIFFPIIITMDFGIPVAELGLWFGILVLIAVEVGLITPPVGLNLFIINKLADNVSMKETYKGVLPFVLSDIIRVIILLAFPTISLFLVRLLY